MSDTPDALAALLAEHVPPMFGLTNGERWWMCGCGVELDPQDEKTNGITPWDHLAAAIRAHLLSDETVERAGRALYIGNTPIGADIARKALEAALGGGA